VTASRSCRAATARPLLPATTRNTLDPYLGLCIIATQGGPTSRVVRRRWASDPAAPSHDARRSCEYEAYVPDRLIGRRFTLDGGVAAEVSEAEAAIAQLNIEAAALVDTEALARILLRAESIASSKIEGLEIGARRLPGPRPPGLSVTTAST
jgi:hypothetical protein